MCRINARKIKNERRKIMNTWIFEQILKDENINKDLKTAIKEVNNNDNK